MARFHSNFTQYDSAVLQKINLTEHQIKCLLKSSFVTLLVAIC